jgi:hypothetical protein
LSTTTYLVNPNTLSEIELNLVENLSTPQSAWYLDSGATYHVSGKWDVFHVMKNSFGNNLRSAGGQGHSITGVGDVHFQFLGGGR